MSEFLPPTPQEHVEYLESEAERYRLAWMSSEATLAMTVARLGGKVEGAPTHRINFLQRVDALREVERQQKMLIRALRKLVACKEFLTHRADTSAALAAGIEALQSVGAKP